MKRMNIPSIFGYYGLVSYLWGGAGMFLVMQERIPAESPWMRVVMALWGIGGAMVLSNLQNRMRHAQKKRMNRGWLGGAFMWHWFVWIPLIVNVIVPRLVERGWWFGPALFFCLAVDAALTVWYMSMFDSDWKAIRDGEDDEDMEDEVLRYCTCENPAPRMDPGMANEEEDHPRMTCVHCHLPYLAPDASR